jgi:uncharacterized cupin superfamily protein
MSSTIVKFSDLSPTPTVDHPRPDRRITGDPERRTRNFYASPDEKISSGEWECEVGAWRIEYPPNLTEFFHLLSGEIVLTSAEGTVTTLKPGDNCVIPPGFRGTFDVRAPARKIYVMVES